MPRTLRVRFLSDAYNYRSGEATGDLGSSVKALRDWLGAIDLLFGDRKRAWEIAAAARLAARQPSWDGIAEIAQDAEAAIANTEGKDSPDARLAAQRERVALAMRRIGDYARVFELALPAVIAGSFAVAAVDARARRLTGLRAVGRLYGPLIWKSRDRGASELDRLARSLSSLDLFALIGEIPAPGPQADFILQPNRLGELAARVTRAVEVATAAEGRSVETSESRRAFDDALERRFWREFSLVGGVSLGRRSALSSASDDPAGLDGLPSGVEILYAVRHGGVPIIPADPSWLSVAELTRIWMLRQGARLELNDEDFAGFALQALRSTPPDSASRDRWGGRFPYLVLDPASADSPSWYWRPEPGVVAVCRIPSDAWDGPNSAEIPLNLYIQLRSLSEKSLLGLNPVTFHAIDAAGTTIDKGLFRFPVIYYGVGDQSSRDMAPYIKDPSGLTGLVDLIHDQRPDLFNGKSAPA